MIYRVVRTSYDVYNNVEVESDGGTSLGCFSSWDAAERKLEEDFLSTMERALQNQKALWGDRKVNGQKTLEEYRAMLPVPYSVKGNQRFYSFSGYMFNYMVSPETLDGQ